MKFSKVAFVIVLIIALATGCTSNNGIQIIEKPPMPTNLPRHNTPYYKNIIKNVPITYSLFPSDVQELSPFALHANDNVCMQFYAVTDFDRLYVMCPNYGNNIGTIKMNLYKWNVNLDYTLTGEILRESIYEDFQDNENLEFKFEPLPEGEYLLEIAGVTEDTGVWSVPEGIYGSRVYYNGVEQQNRSLYSTIRYIHTVDVFTGPLSDNQVYDLEFKQTPAEPILSKNILDRGVQPDTWQAYDGLSRKLPSSADAGFKYDKDRKVGIIYYLRPKVKGTKRNISSLLERYPDAENNPYHGIWNTNSSFYWNEPLFGYYNDVDRYVFRKHAELLSDAGVDVVLINLSYGIDKNLYNAFLDTWSKAREDGVNTPKVAFITDYSSAENGISQAKSLYKDIYEMKKYHDLWFYLDGKPLIFGDVSILNESVRNDEQIRRYFTFRKISTDYYRDTTAEGVWGIQAVYPQTRNSFSTQGNTGQMTVSPAQNVNDRGITAMNGKGVYGRSYSKYNYSYTYRYKNMDITVNSSIADSKLYGINFQQQWDYVHFVDPDFVLVNGWNEGLARKYWEWNGVSNAFPYQYNDECSTDIEPSKGDLKDNYYYQLVANIRRFKGVSSLDYSKTYRTIDITKGANDWKDVGLSYNHYISNIENGNIRNDIITAKVAYDRNNIYFYVETKDALSDKNDPSWMRLFIDTGETDSSWEGFEYVVNRLNPSDEVCYLERTIGGWEWEPAGEVRYSVKGNVLQIEIPRHMLGMRSGWFSSMPSFNFKWADNVQTDGDIYEFYKSGDVAPGGRFTFRFNTD